MIDYQEDGYPFDDARTFRVEVPLADGEVRVVEHRAEVPLSWSQLARIASDEFNSTENVSLKYSPELIGVEDGTPVLFIYKVKQ
jgi:hypothetical protein